MLGNDNVCVSTYRDLVQIAKGDKYVKELTKTVDHLTVHITSECTVKLRMAWPSVCACTAAAAAAFLTLLRARTMLVLPHFSVCIVCQLTKPTAHTALRGQRICVRVLRRP